MAEVIPENTIRVLDHGFVRLDDAMASDLSVVNAARVSFARRKDEMDEADEGLIRFLMRDRHGTPFEHNAFRFHIRCADLRRARVDAAPRRLVQRVLDALREGDRRLLRPGARGRALAGRQAGRLHVRAGGRRARRADARGDRAPSTSRRSRPTSGSSRPGVARELARSVIPVGAYTEFFWTINARSLMNFVSLRAAETAQREIRRYADACERFLAEQMPVTHAAFVAAGRVAP